MRARYVRQLLLLLVFVGNALAQAPAFRLPDTVVPQRYEARLAIDPRESAFAGEIDIVASVKRSTDVVWLNATAIVVERAQVRQGEREVKVEVVAGGEDFVGLRGRFEAGEARIRLSYRGQVDALIVEGIFRQQERGEWYVLTQFQAIGARRAFPCFDEPQWKTPWQLTIDAPASEVVVANTPEEAAAPVEGRSGWTRHRFAQTRPLPSYLVALAVGPFDVVDGGVAGKKRTPLRYLTPKGRGAQARYAKQSTPRILELLEDYFGTPYPFEKLDAITIPQLVTFGAMENVGLITYGSQYMLAHPHEETARFKEIYAGLVAHEVAHMWFGNLVTLEWWDDTWLNEAFASWIGTKVTYRFEPGWNNGAYRTQTRAVALEADRLASARRIRSPVEGKNQIDGAFDDITYSKGEEVLAMFEGWLGPERFKAGVRLFLDRHAWGSATADDFFRALGEAAGDSQRVLAALRGFVDQPGAPLIEATLDCTGSAASIVVEQRRFRPEGSTAGELAWTVPACFRYRVGGKDLTHCAPVDAFTRRIFLPGASSCPSWFVGNVDGAGHYVTRYWPPQLRRIAQHAASVPSLEMQALASDTLLMARSGMLPKESALRIAEAALRHPAPMVQFQGVHMLEELADGLLRPADRAEKARIVRERVVPRARALGWTPRRSDIEDERALRPDLLRFAAERPEGAELRAEALRLSLRWLEDPKAVDATVAQAALEVAGRSADAATFARLESAALATEAQRERSYLLGALVRVRDPALRIRALGLALGKSSGRERIDGRSTLTLLSRALADSETRPVAFGYVRDNVDAIEKKLPKDTMAYLFEPMGRLCTRTARDEFAATFRDRASRYMTGDLKYAQAYESIDLCVSAHR